MRLDLASTLEFAQPPSRVWAFMRNVEQIARCIPGASGVTEVETDKKYTADVADRVGPFRVSVRLDVEVEEIEEGRYLRARVSGADRKTQTLISGTLEARLEGNASARLALSTVVDLRGPLTTLGAPIVRRRATELFEQFAACASSTIESAASEAGSQPSNHGDGRTHEAV